MTTVVTGASGHLGANLVRGLLGRGRHVRALVHVNPPAITAVDVDNAEADIRDPESLRRAFDGADVVYHVAGRISLSMNDWRRLQSVNVIGTQNVVQACLHCGVRRLVHFSSIDALEKEPLDIPVDESRRLVKSGQCAPYDLSKAAGEREVLRGIERGLDAVIINPTALVGPYDAGPSYFGEALLALAQHKLPVLVAGGFDWVDVRDVVEGALQAEEGAPTGARYLLSGHWISVRDLAALVEDITGVPAPRLVSPRWLAAIGAPFLTTLARMTRKRPLYTSTSLELLRSNRHISHEKASRDLHYAPRPFRNTLIDTFTWFQENGFLDRSLVLQPTGSS